MCKVCERVFQTQVETHLLLWTACSREIVENSLRMCYVVSHRLEFVSVSVSAQDGIVALGKAHTRSAPFLSSLPRVVKFEKC